MKINLGDKTHREPFQMLLRIRPRITPNAMFMALTLAAIATDRTGLVERTGATEEEARRVANIGDYKTRGGDSALYWRNELDL